jgi:hypothetical protein
MLSLSITVLYFIYLYVLCGPHEEHAACSIANGDPKKLNSVMTYSAFGKYSDPLTFSTLLRYSFILKWIK